MTLKLITAPATEPVSLADAKLHLRVDGSDEDDLITALIQASREAAEHQLGRALITQEWERVLDAFPPAEIELGMPPVTGITSVTYIDTAEVSTVMDAADYSLDADRLPGWLLPAYGEDWPSTLDTPNAVRVRFVCGYGASASDVPAAIVAWIKIRIGTLYKHREQIAVGVSVSDLPGAFVDRLLDPYRVWSA